MEPAFNFIMDSESDSEEFTLADSQIDNNMIFLAVNLKNYPECLEKSQQPEAKKKKEAALKSLIKVYQENFGYAITTKQMLKKINNMKTRLKKKTEKSQSGDKQIMLNTWEKLLYNLLEGDTRPALTKIPSALNIGASFKSEAGSTHPPETMKDLTATDEDAAEFVSPPKKLKTEKYETEESRVLTTAELQRVVLIEQLSAARAQKEFYIELLAQQRKATNEF